MINVSWKKMFPALLMAVSVALVNTSRSIRTSVPSILSSARALMPTSDLLCAEGNSWSWILLLTFLISLHLRVGFNVMLGGPLYVWLNLSLNLTSLCYRDCFILHSAATSTMGSFSCGGCVLGRCVSNPHAAASCFRENQVHPHHDGTTRSYSALCASCSYFWYWRICSQRHSLSSHHLSWERQGSYCLLSKHCWEHSNCHRNFPSDNRVSEVHQGKVFVAWVEGFKQV